MIRPLLTVILIAMLSACSTTVKESDQPAPVPTLTDTEAECVKQVLSSESNSLELTRANLDALCYDLTIEALSNTCGVTTSNKVQSLCADGSLDKAVEVTDAILTGIGVIATGIAIKNAIDDAVDKVLNVVIIAAVAAAILNGL